MRHPSPYQKRSKTAPGPHPGFAAAHFTMHEQGMRKTQSGEKSEQRHLLGPARPR
jgi:hypothetical protein